QFVIPEDCDENGVDHRGYVLVAVALDGRLGQVLTIVDRDEDRVLKAIVKSIEGMELDIPDGDPIPARKPAEFVPDPVMLNMAYREGQMAHSNGFPCECRYIVPSL